MSSCFKFVVVVCFVSVLSGSVAIAQSDSPSPFSTAGVGIKVSLLGAGVEIATPLTRRSNLRTGFNDFQYSRGFNKDGVTYAGNLNFQSAEVHYDWFPFGRSFHLSPGALIYNDNRLNANASVAGGKSFTLDGTSYTSDPADPITGVGKVDFKKAGPMFSLGWGNLVPRGHHRFSVPFEVGAIYTGSPQAALRLTGSACDPTGANCSPVTSTPDLQSQVLAEQSKLNKDMSAFKFYPVISLGFGVRL
jgi:hypothetical protein